ncbi:MAG TPA: hypothetical protein VE622_01515 [Nitrososphaeraceae archaeon]|jgi:hypothetical protein|nr:hypothetical protein [Nitrososphaeraceae archaeon]
MVVNSYEIHRYQHDNFEYIVAKTNKYSEENVRKDVEKMNAMLTDEMRVRGIKYVFAIGSITDVNKQQRKRKSK